MRSITCISVTAAILVIAVSALAESKSSAGSSGSTTGQVQGQATEPKVEVKEDIKAQAQSSLDSDVEKRLAAIRDKGSRLIGRARARAEADLAAQVNLVKAEAAKDEGPVATRLAADFGMTVAQIVAERASLKVGWGELMVAHTIDANVKAAVGIQELFKLRSDGLGWAQIATGLDLNLGEALSAVQAERRVAVGLVRPDGRVAAIHGLGSKIGVGPRAAAVPSAVEDGADATPEASPPATSP